MDIPDYAIEDIARVLLPHIQKFYACEEGQKIFEQWKEEQRQEKQV